MVEKKKTVTLYWKYNDTLYKKANKEELGMLPQRLGSTTSATSAMIEQVSEMRVLMRSVMDLHPDHKDWDTKLKNWFDSFDIQIPGGQVDFQIGFRYDINNPDKAVYIKELCKKVPNIKTSEDLAEYCEGYNSKGTGNINENEKYKYGSPINVNDYIKWRYCLVNKYVANTIKDVDKSPNIKFYLYNEAYRKAQAKASIASDKAAIKIYLDILEDNDKLDNILSILSDSNISELTYEDKALEMKSIYENKPDKMIDVYKDKNLTTKATIERMIKAGILVRYENSAVIVNANDSSQVIGDNLEAAVSFFNTTKNKTTIDQFKNMLKASKFK